MKHLRDYLLLVLFTGLRKNEAAQLKWSDIDLKAQNTNYSRSQKPSTPCLTFIRLFI